jgi:hypothetical protein
MASDAPHEYAEIIRAMREGAMSARLDHVLRDHARPGCQGRVTGQLVRLRDRFTGGGGAAALRCLAFRPDFGEVPVI